MRNRYYCDKKYECKGECLLNICGPNDALEIVSKNVKVQRKSKI